MNTNSSQNCPSCGTPLDQSPDNLSSGLCPRCLLAESLQTTQGDHQPSPPPSLEEVATAFPDLEVLELIGKGGMGAVYKARQKSLDRFVALKLLPQSLAADPEFAHRFQAEAKALATLNHPNIVTVHDFGKQSDFYFLLMEFVDGPNLRHLIRDQKLTPQEALAIVPPLCEALEFAHQQNIVHRDIKPENLLLDTKGRVKVADFGISKILNQTTPDLDSEKPAGTPAYMAPEQKNNPHAVDTRADIYSLGVVIYEMLTGERPTSDLTPPSGKNATLDVRLDEVVLRALNSNPEHRWQSADALNTKLQTILTEPTSTPTPKDTAHSTPRRATFGFVLTILSVLLFILVFFTTFSGRAVSVPNQAPLYAQKQDLTTQLNQLETQQRELGDNATEQAKKDKSDAIKTTKKHLAEIETKLNPPKTTWQKIGPYIAIILVVTFILSALLGNSYGWRHLSWLRSQEPHKPRLFQAIVAALAWPLLILTIIVVALVMRPIDHGKWTNAAFGLGLMSAICFSCWIISRTLAWSKNQAHPITQNVFLLTFPLIAFATALPAAKYDQYTQSKKHFEQRQSQQRQTITQQRLETANRQAEIEKEISKNFPDHENPTPEQIAENRRTAENLQEKLRREKNNILQLDIQKSILNSARANQESLFNILLPTLVVSAILAGLAFFLIKKTKKANQQS